MIQERHKLLERTLEVDVVFPERVVGIDDQVLAVHCFGRGARWNGISKMASTSTATPSRNAGVNSHFANASRALRSSRSSSWRSNAIPPTWPSLPITPNSRTVPSTRSSAAAAMYLGSPFRPPPGGRLRRRGRSGCTLWLRLALREPHQPAPRKARHIGHLDGDGDRKSTRLNSSHANISYAVFSFK